MQKYLESSEFINWTNPEIEALASHLKGSSLKDTEIAKKCFEFVRDSIRHSWDFKVETITCKASDVLKFQTGYCYAKSHLLAALLRANGIPTGLCYQRLSVDGNGAPYCLHGLNAVYLKEHGWYRMDARGNKEGVQAEFTPPVECLAFSVDNKLEVDLQGIWPEPLPVVIEALLDNNTCQSAYDNLPDIEVY